MQLAMSEQEVLDLCAKEKIAVSAIEALPDGGDSFGLQQRQGRGHRQGKGQIQNREGGAVESKAPPGLTALVNLRKLSTVRLRVHQPCR